MSVYTRKGDKGTTSMFEPNPKKRNKISKASLRVEAIGSVDELNSYLGVANIYTKSKKTKDYVSQIQKELFTIGAILAKATLQLNKEGTLTLEKHIDEIEEKLPPLRNFLMPEGSVSAVHFMYARSLCRRAERAIVSLSKKEKVTTDILQYINRLSDYLFVVFRDENNSAEQKEEIWVGKKV